MSRTTAQCIRAAERVEMLAAELYESLALSFVETPWLRDLFVALASEERQHAMRIRLLERHQGTTPWLPQALEPLCRDLDAMAAEIEGVRVEFRRPGAVRSPSQVLQRVAEMERRFGSLHAEELSRSASPEVSRLFRSLALQDARHRQLLEQAKARAA
jgi:rubrerythrin